MNHSTPDDRRDFAQRALRASAIATTISLAVLLIVFEGRILFALLAGVLFAFFLEGVSGLVAKALRVPYGVVLAVLAVSIAVSTALGAYFLGAAAGAQINSLSERVPEAWRSLLDAVHHRPALAQVVGPLAEKAPTVSANVARVATGAAGAFEAVGILVLIFFLGVYGAAQPESYRHVILALVPLGKRRRARAVLAEIGVNLQRWLYGRAIAMVMVGVCIAVGLALMRVPLAAPLGVLAGLLAFVEYLGSVASAAPAMLLAFTRGPIYALWVALLFTGVHLVEGYVLTPLLARKMIRIPPGYMLGTQVVLGTIFGVAGLTFATPVLVIATILVRRIYVEDALGDGGGGESSA